MGANTRDAPALTGLILARRRRRVGTVDLLVKSNPGDAAPAVYGDLYFDTPAAGGNYVLTAQGGTYTVAGGPAILERDRRLTASGGSYSVTGSSAIVEKDRRLTASGGAYAVAGGQAVIERDRRLTATGGAYTLTGGQAVITWTGNSAAYVLTALGGSYTITGASAVLEKDRRLTAQGGAYSVTGGQAVVERDRRLTAQGGAYSLAGGTANITKTSTNAYVLTALGGSYAVTGGDASITLTPSQTPRNGGFEMGGPTPRKVYIKRGKRIHIFDTVEDADEWLEAEDKARQVVNVAKPKPQAKAKVFKALDEAVPHDVVRLDVVRSMVDYLGIPVEMPTLEARQDWAEVARVALMARHMQDEEDIELLLVA